MLRVEYVTLAILHIGQELFNQFIFSVIRRHCNGCKLEISCIKATSVSNSFTPPNHLKIVQLL